MADRKEFQRSDEEFFSNGTRCAAWLYRPTGVPMPPIIIMAHGLAAERCFGLPDFAERFAAEGWAVLVFDYRTLGDSDGSPRNNIDPFRHNEDWDAAIDFVRKRSDIDVSRIALWGTSFSGGHVTCTATRHADVSGIIAQVPYTGMASDGPRPPLLSALRLMMHVLLDRIKTAVTGNPHYIPALGKPGTFAVMNTPECWEGYLALVPDDRHFDNQIPAKLIGMMPNYDPTALADQVECPALVIAGRDDSLVDVALVEKMASRMPRGSLRILDCNHFAPYKGEMFELNIAMQIEFLKEVFA